MDDPRHDPLEVAERDIVKLKQQVADLETRVRVHRIAHWSIVVWLTVKILLTYL